MWFSGLGDILPQKTKCPQTKCPKDILPQIAKILEGGHIAPTPELWWTFCPNFFFCIFLWHISGKSWAYLGHIYHISHHAYVEFFFVTFATAPNGLFIFYGPSQYLSSFSSWRPKSKKISFSRISIATCKNNSPACCGLTFDATDLPHS